MKGGAVLQLHTPEFMALIYAIGLDYITGLGVAIYQKKVKSSIGRKGIIQKFGLIVCAVFCSLIDTVANTELLKFVCIGLIVNEGISIVENLKKINICIPKILTDTLKSLSSGEEKKKK